MAPVSQYCAQCHRCWLAQVAVAAGPPGWQQPGYPAASAPGGWSAALQHLPARPRCRQRRLLPPLKVQCLPDSAATCSLLLLEVQVLVQVPNQTSVARPQAALHHHRLPAANQAPEAAAQGFLGVTHFSSGPAPTPQHTQTLAAAPPQLLLLQTLPQGPRCATPRQCCWGCRQDPRTWTAPVAAAPAPPAALPALLQPAAAAGAADGWPGGCWGALATTQGCCPQSLLLPLPLPPLITLLMTAPEVHRCSCWAMPSARRCCY